MDDALAALEPRLLWKYFAAMAATPRPSRHEQQISAWARSVAEKQGWKIRTDDVGNLVFRVPPSPGREKAPIVILQAHLDMVCEKNKDQKHDFMKEPIRPRIVDDWVYATGTTLGADNGIGAAAALAAATDPQLVHGPLEILFTMDEETGLTGAAGLDPSMLEGRVLVNMDSEEDGKLFVGCAGGADCHLFVDVERQAPAPGGRAFTVEVGGLRGGHSGIEIHENRGNALKLLTRLLVAAIDAGVDLELAELDGGSKHNAIPREAQATIRLARGAEQKFRGVADRMLEALRSELKGIDDGLSIRVEPSETDAEVLRRSDRDRFLHLLVVLPHGVLGMSSDIPGLVQTSNNLAVVQKRNGTFKVITSARSSVAPSQEAVLGVCRSAARLAGARVEVLDGYPGWKPDMDSRALAVTREVYAELWGRPPEVTAVHAGLECGLLGRKIPGLDMISFGPQIEGAHSPDERVSIASVDRFWNALVRVLDRLAR